MKKSAAAHLRVLSGMTADPTKVARAMLDTGKKHMKLTRRQISLNTLERLMKKQLGTEDVERMSEKVVKQGKKRDVAFINFVMRRRKQDAEDKTNKARTEWLNSLRYLASLLSPALMEEYTKFLKTLVESVWEAGRSKMKSKIVRLEERYHPWKKPVQPRFNEIKISDAELEPMEEQEQQVIVPIYGGVTVPREVDKVLKLPPKFALYPKVDMKMVEMEVERGIWKARWEDRSEEQRGKREEMTEEQVEEVMAETRVWDDAAKELNFSKIRVTQLPTNRRVVAPKPLSGPGRSKEVQLQFLKSRLLDETRKHLKKEYDEKGRPKENNITPQEVKGLKAAKDITEDGSVIIRPTDKTSKHCIDSSENYARKMEEHIKNDPVITEKEKERCVRECNGHASFWRRMVNLGEAHPVNDALGDRMTSALSQDQNMLPPPMVGNHKDHKACTEPPLRPVCQAKGAPNNILSWILAKLVGKVGEEAPESRSVSSTEELQAKMMHLNTRLMGEKRKVGIGSMDVVGLYPALEKAKVKEIMRTMLQRTEVKVAEVNWSEVAVYLACTHSQEDINLEGLQEVVPRWRHRPQGGGNRPGITSKRAMQGPDDKEDDGEGTTARGRRRAAVESWLPPQRLPTEEERKSMFSMAVIAGVMGFMDNHCYRFNGQTRRQADGGSIGNQLTGEVADVVMAWWSGEFDKLAKGATIDIMPEFIIDSGLYVDDNNLAFFILPPGARWNEEEKKMIIVEENVEEDEQKPGDVRTMVEMTKMANSISQIIQWTSDCPGENEDGKMPSLDLKVWLSETDGEQKVQFEFFRKPNSTRLLILARSAMPSRVKRAALTQEALRILRNCSPDVPWKRKAEFLTDFCLRMKLSGYPERYRAAIIESALKAWDKILLDDLLGVRPLYRTNTWKKEERRKKKELKKINWFTKTGGKANDFPIFCPMTPGGRLAEKWRRVADEVRINSGGKIRPAVVEQSGLPISALLVDPTQGEQDLCGKAECNPCQTGTTKRMSCHRSGVGGMVYSCTCLTCKEKVVQVDGKDESICSMYHGRSHRCLITRQNEHQAGYEGRKDENALYKHHQLFHPGEDCHFSFEAEKFFNDAMSHQIYEGVCINNTPSTPGYLMNSRAEYEQGAVARLSVEHGL